MTAHHALAPTAASGARSTMIWQAARAALQMLSVVALARMLDPADFGLVAMATAIIGVGELVRDFGLSSAAVQARTLSSDQRSNLFWINTGIGGVLSVAAACAAPLIALAYGDERLVGVTVALAPTFLLNGAATQFRVELNRRLRFTALNAADVGPAVCGLAAAVAVAMLGAGYWALVVQQITVALIGLLWPAAVARWRPGAPARSGDVRDLMRFGGGVLGTQLAAYVTKNADTVALGATLGPAVLGIYSRAYQLVVAPLNLFLAPLTRVALPLLSRVRDDRATFHRWLQVGQLSGAWCLGAVLAVLAGLSSPVVELLLGPRWAPVGPVLRVLAAGALFRGLYQVVYWAFLATGNATAQLRFYLVSQPVLVVLMLAGLPFGAVGVATGLAVGAVLNWAGGWWWCGRVTGVPSGRLVRRTTGLLLAVPLPLYVVNDLAARLMDGAWVAIGAGGVGSAVYVGLLFGLSRAARGEAARIVRLVRLRASS